MNSDIEPIQIELEPPLAWIKLHRPKAANSLNRPLLNKLSEVCVQLALAKNVQIVVIIGAGTSIFCAGADLKERKQLTSAETIDYHLLIQKTFLAIEALPQPVIAAINGSAYGGGTELTLACDLRIMVKNATLQFPEVKLGIIPGAGGTQRLSRLIGKSKAMEMILTGAPLSALDAKAYGLVHRVVEATEEPDTIYHLPFMAAVRAWATEIIQGAPLALRKAKWAINQGYSLDLQSGLTVESQAFLELLNTKDRLEGLHAFAEKRTPQYSGE